MLKGMAYKKVKNYSQLKDPSKTIHAQTRISTTISQLVEPTCSNNNFYSAM
jgi:hypothetical protein